MAGHTLADFNHAAMVNGNKSLANYTRCISAVTLGAFPHKVLQDQKRWMRCFLKKPRDMLVQDYITNVTEINNYLPKFLLVTQGGNSTKIPDKELLDLLEFGITIKWQQQIQVQNFHTTAGTLCNFQDFCKRLKSALDDPPPVDNKSNKTPGKEKGNKKCLHNNSNNKDKKSLLHVAWT